MDIAVFMMAWYNGGYTHVKPFLAPSNVAVEAAARQRR